MSKIQSSNLYFTLISLLLFGQLPLKAKNDNNQQEQDNHTTDALTAPSQSSQVDNGSNSTTTNVEPDPLELSNLNDASIQDFLQDRPLPDFINNMSGQNQDFINNLNNPPIQGLLQDNLPSSVTTNLSEQQQQDLIRNLSNISNLNDSAIQDLLQNGLPPDFMNNLPEQQQELIRNLTNISNLTNPSMQSLLQNGLPPSFTTDLPEQNKDLKGKKFVFLCSSIVFLACFIFAASKYLDVLSDRIKRSKSNLK